MSDETRPGHYLIPFAFDGAGPWRQPIPVPRDASEELRQLLAAEALILTAPDRWREAVETITGILRDHRPGKAPDLEAWPPVHFAGVAVKACLARGDLPLAKKVLAVGLKLRLADELRYLARIVDRESSAETSPAVVRHSSSGKPR